MEAAVAGLLLRHRVEDELPQPPPSDRRTREEKHIETLSQRSRKLREALASLPERKGAKGQDLKVNLTDPDSATMRTSHGTVQGYRGRDKVNAQWTLFCLVHNLQKLQPRIVQRQHNAAPKRQQEGR